MTKADIVNEISKNTGIEKAVVLETDNNSGPQHSGI